MERRIRFRGKTLKGDWISGYLYRTEEKSFILRECVNEELNMIRVIPKSVGQETGLIDRNDFNIYEGDIVELTHFDHNDNDRNQIGIIVYKLGCFWVEIEDTFYPLTVCDLDYSARILGNSYDKRIIK